MASVSHLQAAGAAVDPVLLDRVDEKLAVLRFSEADVPTYQLVIDGEAFTWHPGSGFTPGESRAATCRLALDASSLAALVAGTATCDDLVESRKLEIGGYYFDWQAFVSAFLDDRGRKQVDLDRGRNPSTRAKQRALLRAERVLAEVTSDRNALARIHHMLELWREHRFERFLPNHTELIPFPGLDVTPWGSDAVARDIDALVVENLAALQAESRQFLTNEVHAPVYGHSQSGNGEAEPLFYNAPRGWRNYWLVNQYRRKPDAVFARLPVTARVVDELARRHTFVHVAYLIMEPGCHLRHHADGASLFLHSYHGVIVPEGCYLDCYGERRALAEGTSLVFSDAFVHSAGNDGASPRVVLALLYLNPQLTEIEQICIRRLQDVLPRGTLVFSGEYD
jgi:hypothetical protein